MSTPQMTVLHRLEWLIEHGSLASAHAAFRHGAVVVDEIHGTTPRRTRRLLRKDAAVRALVDHIDLGHHAVTVVLRGWTP